MAKQVGVDDLQVIEIKGRGLVFRDNTGMVFIENAKIGENGEYVADGVPSGPVDITKPGVMRTFTSQSDNQIKAFQEEMARRNLSADGEYGTNGPYLAKLRNAISEVEPTSPQHALLGGFLQSGDHMRYGRAAAVVDLSEKGREELMAVLKNPSEEKLEEFIDRVARGLLKKEAAPELKFPE